MPQPMSDVDRVKAISSDPILSGAEPDPGDGQPPENTDDHEGPDGGADQSPSQPAAEKKYKFRDPAGKEYEAKLGEDGTISIADIEAVLRDPADHYRRHFSAVENQRVAKAVREIEENKLGNISQTLRDLGNRLAQLEPHLTKPATTQQAQPETQSFDWSRVDANDPLAIAQALQAQQTKTMEDRLVKMLDERFGRLTEGDRVKATESLGQAYEAWKEHGDLNEFKSRLRQAGIAVTKDGVDFTRSPAWAVTNVANGLIEHLHSLKRDQARMDTVLEKAIAAMPSDEQGPIWDDEMTGRLKGYIADQIESGRPFDTDQDAFLIALEGAKEIARKDTERTAKMASRLAKIIAKAKGKKEAVPSEKEPGEDKKPGMTAEERDEARRKRMKVDGFSI